MPARRPLVLGDTGLPQQLQAGDSLADAAGFAFTSAEQALEQLLINQSWMMRALVALLDDQNLTPLSAIDTEQFFSE